MKLNFRHAVCSLSLMCFSPFSGAQVIDGVITSDELKGATLLNDFRQVEPETNKVSSDTTLVYIKNTEDGLYIAFENSQDKQSRVSRYHKRDEDSSADNNEVIVGFGNETSYYFSVSLGGGYSDAAYSFTNGYNYDVDLDWQFASSQNDDKWFTEILIPANIIATNINQDDPVLKLWFSREIKAKSEKFAFPYTKPDNPSFLLKQHEFQTAAYELDFDSRYEGYILNSGDSLTNSKLNYGLDFDFSIDSGKHKVMGTVKPDFGTAESDEIVLNYSSTETLRSDKRHFFSRNNELFNINFFDEVIVFHTRRVGDSSRSQEVDFAAKYFLNAGSAQYGAFVAQEESVVPGKRNNYALFRAKKDFDNAYVGVMSNYADIGGEISKVHTLDMAYWSDKSRINSMFIVSDDNAQSDSKNGFVYDFRHDYSEAFRFKSRGIYLEDGFDINSSGYNERGNIFKVSGRFEYIVNEPEEFVSSYTQAVGIQYSKNLTGYQLQDEYYYQIDATIFESSNLHFEYLYTESGFNDNTLDDNQVVHLPSLNSYYVEFTDEGHSIFEYSLSYQRYQQGLSDWTDSYYASTNAKISELFSIGVDTTIEKSNDWVIGESENELGRYKSDSDSYSLSGTFNFGKDNELIFKAEYQKVDAVNISMLSVDQAGNISSTSSGDDFLDEVVSAQVRYRVKLNDRLEVLVVYNKSSEKNYLGKNLKNKSKGFSDLLFENGEDVFISKIKYVF
ncbi:DUF5916 domain-containing protein [Pseudoalteromonas sp. SMS1]|uniref:DUF5916 domain-containing protein n=1 Tax=Pseudoalteromonas sp. SMS1 TaxID=2908894 RepID=UPI001F2456EE|nr:DUF5916 domain-containing protein [Pseudoalteromonas sp. SMS1]MCF2859115.1 DUF5916 domain-containing protein [Pseudoalteromonas sp. SMS1]